VAGLGIVESEGSAKLIAVYLIQARHGRGTSGECSHFVFLLKFIKSSAEDQNVKHHSKHSENQHGVNGKGFKAGECHGMSFSILLDELYQIQSKLATILGIVDQSGRDYRAAVCLLVRGSQCLYREGQHLTSGED